MGGKLAIMSRKPGDSIVIVSSYIYYVFAYLLQVQFRTPGTICFNDICLSSLLSLFGLKRKEAKMF